MKIKSRAAVSVIVGAGLMLAGNASGADVFIEAQSGDAMQRQAPNALPQEAVPDFGTPRFWSSLDSYAMHGYDNGFVPLRSTSTGLFCQPSSTDSRAVGQLQVPHGVRLNLFRAWMYDVVAAQDMTVSLQSACLPDFGGAIPTVTALGSVGTTGTSGVQSASTFAGDSIADNQSCTYQVVVQFGSSINTCTTNNLGFYKLRMQWYRQVPPAPGVASFTDVPVGSQFYSEVQALVGSGVTAGCTASQYCPSQAVTRLQMAAFLARALGFATTTIADPANP